MSTFLSIYTFLPVCLCSLSVSLCDYLPVSLSVYLPVCMSTFYCLSTFLSVCLPSSVYLSVFLSPSLFLSLSVWRAIKWRRTQSVGHTYTYTVWQAQRHEQRFLSAAIRHCRQRSVCHAWLSNSFSKTTEACRHPQCLKALDAKAAQPAVQPICQREQTLQPKQPKNIIIKGVQIDLCLNRCRHITSTNQYCLGFNDVNYRLAGRI